MQSGTVLLFDIDGTLVTTGGAGRKAMEGAFERHSGRRDAMRFPFGGMTDRAIVRRGLGALGLSDTETEIDRVLELYLALLEGEVAAARDYAIYPGIVEALDRAAASAGTAVGLGTGNVRQGARIKLARVKLHERFAFGGFGCDREGRAELLKRGAERGAESLGVPLERCRVVVIGDTVRDVEAGLAIGAEVLAVGTGGEDLDELRARGATWAFEDLTEPAAISALFP